MLLLLSAERKLSMVDCAVESASSAEGRAGGGGSVGGGDVVGGTVICARVEELVTGADDGAGATRSAVVSVWTGEVPRDVVAALAEVVVSLSTCEVSTLSLSRPVINNVTAMAVITMATTLMVTRAARQPVRLVCSTGGTGDILSGEVGGGIGGMPMPGGAGVGGG